MYLRRILLNKPSTKQNEAIKHMNGPMMVIAGPGSGKTFVIISRIMNLLNEKVNEENILVVTFSKAATQEMRSRLEKEIGKSRVHFATFHSISYEILRNSFSFSTSSIILDKDKQSIISHILKNRGLNKLATFDNINLIISSISKNKNSDNYDMDNNSSPLEELNDNDYSKVLSDYNSYLKDNHLLDFDDMIIKCINKLRVDSNILELYQNEFEYILVDEFQDINNPQYDLLRLLGKKYNNVFVVGDDDQSIYGFRGSNPEKMFKFQEDFNSPNTVILENNYRSSKQIVDFASSIIKENKYRFSKKFIPANEDGTVSISINDTKKEEEDSITRLLNSFGDEDYNETAIILRTNREVMQYHDLLKKNNIPVCETLIKKKSILDNEIIKDIKAYLKFIYEGFRREDFIIFMNKPNHYFQRTSLKDEIVSKKILLDAYRYNSKMIVIINNLFSKIELASKMNIDMAVSLFRKAIGYDKYITEISKTQDELRENMNILDQIPLLFKKYNYSDSIEDYINSLKLESEQNKKEVYRTKGVNLMTMHTSKGLEFNNVILPDVNEGVIPSKNAFKDAIEEERRLFYVSVTRAKRNLYIFTANERNKDISRFIKNIM